MSALLASAGPSAYWYLTRSTGAVALVLLSAAVVIGVVDVRRWSTLSWPRFIVDALHRNVSLLALAFVGVHVITSVLDSFAPISIAAAFIPFISSYRPFWLGLGSVAFDMLLAIAITSMLRERFSQRTWRRAHWLAYACWPIALLHGFGTGSDVKSAWMLLVSIACLGAVLAAVLARTLAGWASATRPRSLALGGVGAFSLFLALWLPGGPLGKEWARRAGTPVSLLKHASSTPKAGK